MSERDRYKETPGLAHAAEAACSYYLTDGFCMPRSCQGCKCWDRAKAAMEATGLSARAIGWIFQHRGRIEKQAESDETKTYGGTPWWSRPAAEGLLAGGEPVRSEAEPAPSPAQTKGEG